MRLRSLSLDRFGHFTSHTLEFGAADDRPDFHIIYGPNEAGKTTTMEAALRLFYGFPHREPYAFKHQRANLSVSGVVEIAGETRSFTRLPKRSGALVDASGAALPDTALATHLGGLGEDDYRQLLCLDDETIERGGEEIAQARGDIGRLLFSAAAGVADLTTVLDGVRAEADALWRKRASKTQVATLKRALAEVEKDIRERDVTASAWRGLKKALADAHDAEARARATRDALHEQAAEIAARQRALPMLADLDALAERLAPFADYPERLGFDLEDLVTLKSDQTGAESDIERLTTEIAALTAQRRGLALSPKLVRLAEELDALEALRARDLSNALDLPKRRAQVIEAQDAMARAARELGAPDGCDPQSLVPTQVQLADLDAARDRLRSARATARTEAQEVADLTARRDRARQDHETLIAQSPTGAAIGPILSRHQADSLMPAHATAQQSIATAERTARAALDALGTAAQRFNRPPEPSMSIVRARELAAAHDALSRKIDTDQTALAQHQEDISARNAQIAELYREGQIVPDVRAAALRAERDRLWQAHLTTLDTASAQDFATAMQAFDVAQDMRITHASELGQLRQSLQAMAEAQARSDTANARLAEHRSGLEDIADEIGTASRAVGRVGAASPAEWLDWMQRHDAATAAARAAAQARYEHAATLERAQALLDELTPHLDLAAPDLTGAVAAARRMAEVEREARSAAEAARKTLDGAEAALAARLEKQERSLQDAAEAKADWHALVTECFGKSIAPDTLLAALDPLRSLAMHEKDRAEAAQRVANMERDMAVFGERVAALADAHDIACAETPADSFALLRTASEDARKAAAQAQDLDGRIAQAQTLLARARQRQTEIDATVSRLAKAFPPGAQVDTLDALRATAGQAAQVISDRTEYVVLSRRLVSELDAADIDGVRARLTGASHVALNAQADGCKADLARAETALTTATEARTTASQALAQVTAGGDVAALTERRATLELELQEAALAHLELSLGHRLAEAAIRRYRDTHRSGMMEATERCFAALTQGAYTRLTTQPDGTDEILLAIDADGVAKRAADMSKGTRFQLYLALRAAAHEQLVAQGTCLPFFCDDIFETFDENRTSAACRVMEQIGRSGQAIYLTHHRHVVDIARQVCETPPIVHEL